MNVLEAADNKKNVFHVLRYDGPKHLSNTVIDQTTVHADTKAELRRKIGAWMEEIGLDPKDEDDLSSVEWTASS